MHPEGQGQGSLIGCLFILNKIIHTINSAFEYLCY